MALIPKKNCSINDSFLLRRDLVFLSERGIIQGGTESALSWIALYCYVLLMGLTGI
jgi:hypothetical protein